MIVLQVTCPYCHKTLPVSKYFALPQTKPDILVLRCRCGGTFSTMVEVLPVVPLEDDAA